MVNTELTNHNWPVAIATMTKSNGDECDGLIASVQELSRHGQSLAIVDAASPEPVVQAWTALDRARVRFAGQYPGSGLVAQVRCSLAMAVETGSPYILYTEPDKIWFFRQNLDAFLRRALPRKLDLVVAARTERAFARYAAAQRHIEAAFNDLAGWFLTPGQDYLYGPLLMQREFVRDLLQAIQNDWGWGWRVYAIATSLGAKSPEGFVPGDYPDPAQTHTGDDLYRLEQFEQNVRALKLAVLESRRAGSTLGSTHQTRRPAK